MRDVIPHFKKIVPRLIKKNLEIYFFLLLLYPSIKLYEKTVYPPPRIFSFLICLTLILFTAVIIHSCKKDSKPDSRIFI